MPPDSADNRRWRSQHQLKSSQVYETPFTRCNLS